MSICIRRPCAVSQPASRSVLWYGTLLAIIAGAFGDVRSVQIRAHGSLSSVTTAQESSRKAFVRREDLHARDGGLRDDSKLRVAFVAFVTDIKTLGWQDALYVLAHGIKRAASRSRHSITAIALVPEELSAANETVLRDAGFQEIVRKPIPVRVSEIQTAMARENMARVQGKAEDHNTFVLAHETIKYWGLAMDQYDRALVIDADVMILDPMDELMERSEDFVGTYDHGLDTDGSTLPPTQGGFLLFRPSRYDFEAICQLTREGDWADSGWKHSGIGWCYGGVGPDGLLAYYFNRDALDEIHRVTKEALPEGVQQQQGVNGSRMLAVDRVKYDLVMNDRLREELARSTVDHETTLSNVKSVHFTGDCLKPWTCLDPRDTDWLCKGLVAKWWDLRASLEAERKLPPSAKSCINNQYIPMALKKTEDTS